MLVVDGPGLRLVAEDQRGGVNGCRAADPPSPPLSPIQKKLKERRPESVEMAKLYIPLENQESMFIKRHQKPMRKKKSGD